MRRGSNRLQSGLPAVLAMIATAGLVAAATPAVGKTVIKMATQAPRASPWASGLFRLAARVRKQTRGQVVVRIYAGGVAGTEPQTIRLMKRGQLHAVAISGAGITGLEPSLRVFELPGLFQNHKELHYVFHHMERTVQKRLKQRGYRLLGLTTPGPVYMFSKRPLRDMADLRARKVWTWDQDPVAKAVMVAGGLQAVVSKVTDVLPAFKNGTIDTIYAPPHFVLALGWSSHVSWMLDFRVNFMVGFLLIRKDTFDSLTGSQQKALLSAAKNYTRKINKTNARINAGAIKVMRAAGLRQCSPTAGFRSYVSRILKRTWARLQGRVYRAEDLKQIQTLLSRCRTTSCRF